MIFGDDERKQLLREIGSLRQDFERLYLADAKGTIQTHREATLSRSPIAKPAMTLAQLNPKRKFEHYGGGDGIELGHITPQTIDAWDAAPIFYQPRTGEPLVNAVGQSLVSQAGWLSRHSYEISGTHIEQAIAAITKANDWVNKQFKAVALLLFAGRNLTLSGFSWPDIVLQVAEQDDSTLSKVGWVVEIGCVELRNDNGEERLVSSMETRPVSMQIELWGKRRQLAFNDCQPFSEITRADELYIGDEPEIYHCERRIKTFLRDSELALGWLLHKLESDENQAVEPETKSTQSIQAGDENYSLEETVSKMPKRFRLAYRAAEYAALKSGKELKDREAFDWLEQNGFDDYELPMYDTFTDYLTSARKETNEPRKTRRQDRTCRSVIRQSEL